MRSTLLHKLQGIVYVLSRTVASCTAGQTKVFDYPVMGHWRENEGGQLQVLVGRKPMTCQSTVHLPIHCAIETPTSEDILSVSILLLGVGKGGQGGWRVGVGVDPLLPPPTLDIYFDFKSRPPTVK